MSRTHRRTIHQRSLLPESSSSSQGFNLKEGMVSASMMQPLNFLGLRNFVSSLRFFLYFYKSIRSEVWHFQFPLTQIYCLHASLLSFKQSFCFSGSLRIVFTLTSDYFVTRAYIWDAYHKPQFISYLSKYCLPLVFWAHYLLKRLLAINISKIPNLYTL